MRETMTVLLDRPAQLDLWGETEPVLSENVPGVGRCLLTPGGGWRAKYTGTRYGWLIDRRITWTEPHRVWDLAAVQRGAPSTVYETREDWEGWEPALPYGVEHITDRATAVQVLLDLAAKHGDDPRWLDRYCPGR